METYARQQFDLLLLTAADRFCERAVQRCEGADNAHRLLAVDPDAPGLWLSGYVDAVFAEMCLEDVAGACFVLAATERRSIALSADGKVGEVLQAMARQVFAELLRAKAAEGLARAGSGYG